MRFGFVSIACFALALSGCGDGSSTVDGELLLDGTPVKEASVTFLKTGDGAMREGAVVKDGKFSMKLKPGDYRVEVTGRKVTGTRKQKDFDGKMEEVELTGELFPERYNVKSELKETVKAGGNRIKLDLKGK